MVFGGGMSSRLFQRVREELGLAYSVHTYQSFHVDAGVQGVYVATRPRRRRARPWRRSRDELRQLCEAGLPGDELAAAKRQLKGQITLSMESVTNHHATAAAAQVLYDEPFRRSTRTAGARSTRSARRTCSPVCREFFDPERQPMVSLGPKPVA
jgi:predicted Zn-dependent peptidase